MTIRKLLQIGDPKLKEECRLLDKSDLADIKIIVQDLGETIEKCDIIGLAAPQIGESIRLFVTRPRQTKYRASESSDGQRVFINPEITNYSTETSVIYEGCGSVCNADLYGSVERPREVTIEAYDADFKKFRLQCDGLLARVIQHEYDHLNGIEFIEKVTNAKKFVNLEFYLKNVRGTPQQKQPMIITKAIYTELE